MGNPPYGEVVLPPGVWVLKYSPASGNEPLAVLSSKLLMPRGLRDRVLHERAIGFARSLLDDASEDAIPDIGIRVALAGREVEHGRLQDTPQPRGAERCSPKHRVWRAGAIPSTAMFQQLPDREARNTRILKILRDRCGVTKHRHDRVIERELTTLHQQHHADARDRFGQARDLQADVGLHRFARDEPGACEAIAVRQQEPTLVCHGERSPGHLMFLEYLEHRLIKCVQAGQGFPGDGHSRLGGEGTEPEQPDGYESGPSRQHCRQSLFSSMPGDLHSPDSRSLKRL